MPGERLEPEVCRQLQNSHRELERDWSRRWRELERISALITAARERLRAARARRDALHMQWIVRLGILHRAEAAVARCRERQQDNREVDCSTEQGELDAARILLDDSAAEIREAEAAIQEAQSGLGGIDGLRDQLTEVWHAMRDISAEQRALEQRLEAGHCLREESE